MLWYVDHHMQNSVTYDVTQTVLLSPLKGRQQQKDRLSKHVQQGPASPCVNITGVPIPETSHRHERALENHSQMPHNATHRVAASLVEGWGKLKLYFKLTPLSSLHFFPFSLSLKKKGDLENFLLVLLQKKPNLAWENHDMLKKSC